MQYCSREDTQAVCSRWPHDSRLIGLRVWWVWLVGGAGEESGRMGDIQMGHSAVEALWMALHCSVVQSVSDRVEWWSRIL